MANHASTDEIVLTAYNTSKQYWKEFIGFPIAISAGFFLLMGIFTWLSTTTGGMGGLLFLVFLAFSVLWVAYFGAQVKWCEQLHQGATSIDLKEGLRYGLSRFWGVIGTGLLTWIKIVLWTLLLILPGYYKGLMYSKSIYVSILEQKSGGDANRISEAIVKKAGPIRTLSNLMGVTTLWYLATFILVILAALVSGLFGMAHDMLGLIVGSVLMGGVMAFSGTVFMLYFHFEYLSFRDEAQTEVNQLKKALS